MRDIVIPAADAAVVRQYLDSAVLECELIRADLHEPEERQSVSSRLRRAEALCAASAGGGALRLPLGLAGDVSDMLNWLAEEWHEARKSMTGDDIPNYAAAAERLDRARSAVSAAMRR
jgi:hypothetical protein